MNRKFSASAALFMVAAGLAFAAFGLGISALTSPVWVYGATTTSGLWVNCTRTTAGVTTSVCTSLSGAVVCL